MSVVCNTSTGSLLGVYTVGSYAENSVIYGISLINITHEIAII